MKFHFVKRSEAHETFRVSSIMGKYDLSSVDVIERFDGEIPFETVDGWKIGVIVGGSGTGKTQIAKQLFPASYIFQWAYSAACVIEDMPSEATTDDIARAFNAVGFTTAKSWLKPYSVLSMGERMRVDLARAILDKRRLIVFDEFSSVVDRKVARVGAFAVQKAIRRSDGGKQFIAVSCHNDIVEWLEPDWVFCTDDMTFTDTRRSLRRPAIKVDIHEVKGYWNLFVKYHYMNANILPGSDQYVAFVNGEPVAFCAITHLVHNTILKGKRLHRLVVLPDYQGVGIGSRLLDFCASRYFTAGYRMFARFSHPALIASLERNSKWKLLDAGSRSPLHEGIDKMNESGSNRRYTTGWEYVTNKE
jgi:GNAT superfamily N-acetyltransferase